MNLQGKLFAKMDSESGQSAKGNWKKQVFVIETMEQYPKKVAFEAWNDDCRTLDDLEPGNIINVTFNIESREYEGKWYTTAKSWKIQVMGK